MGAGATDENKVSMLGGQKTRLQTSLADSQEQVSSSLDVPGDKRAVIPDLLVGRLNSQISYLDRNRIVDPIEAEKQRSIASWTLDDLKIFVERYATHPKNFKRISAHLPDKWESDCVELYYRLKLSLQLKKFSLSPSTQESRKKFVVASGGQKSLTQMVLDDALLSLKALATYGGVIPDNISLQFSQSCSAGVILYSNRIDDDEIRKYMFESIQYIFVHCKNMLPSLVSRLPEVQLFNNLQSGQNIVSQVGNAFLKNASAHDKYRASGVTFPYAIPLGYE